MAIEAQRMTYSVEEAAAILGVSKSKLYESVRNGELRGVQLGRRVVIPCDALEELIGPLPVGERSAPRAVAQPRIERVPGDDDRTEVNAVQLTGRLVRQPGLRMSRTGLPVCTLRLAVSRRRRGGEPRGALHVDVVAFGTVAEGAAQLAGGEHITVTGRLGQREWTSSDGSQHARFEIVADELQATPRCEPED